MEHLVSLDLQHSNLKVAWKDNKFLSKLKVLNLNHSHSLRKTPDFSRLPNHEELVLRDCIKLIEIHQSIGQLERLVLVNINGRKEPGSICRVKSLKVLNIAGCSKFDKLPENLGEMESLMKFVADGTAITQVPLSIVCLKNLKKLSLCGCKISKPSSVSSFIWSWVSRREDLHKNCMLITSLSGLTSLTSLKLMDCNLSDDAIPRDIGSLLFLEDLDLRKNNFFSLPDTVGGLSKLKSLKLNDCTELELLPDMPTNLFTLSAINCTSLKSISVSKFRHVPRLFLTNCSKIEEISGLDKLRSAGTLHMEWYYSLSSNFKEFLCQDWCGYGYRKFFLPGSDIPDWFGYQSKTPSLSCQMPPFQVCKLQGFTVCIVYSSESDTKEPQPFPIVTIKNKRNQSIFTHYAVTYENIPVTVKDHMWMFHLPPFMINKELGSEDPLELTVDFGGGPELKRLGVSFANQICPHCCLLHSSDFN